LLEAFVQLLRVTDSEVFLWAAVIVVSPCMPARPIIRNAEGEVMNDTNSGHVSKKRCTGVHEEHYYWSPASTDSRLATHNASCQQSEAVGLARTAAWNVALARFAASHVVFVMFAITRTSSTY
jgi:hypothetical protein